MKQVYDVPLQDKNREEKIKRIRTRGTAGGGKQRKRKTT
jgi:hypothetical protein